MPAGTPATSQPDQGSSPVRVLVLTKPSTTRSREQQVEAALQAMRERAEVQLVTTDGASDLERAVLGHDADRVVVMGGDGSVHALAQLLHDAGRLTDAAPVGIVPLGTGNDLARGLGLPLDPAAAGTLAVTGPARRSAVLLDEDDQVVVNAVHASAGAEATARTRSKSLLGRYAYHVGAVVTGLRARGWHLRVSVDGRPLHDGEHPVLMVAVGLGGTIGGGAPVAPDADPVDGRAEVTVSLATSWPARFAYAVALRSGRHHQRRDVLRAHGREVTVEVVRGKAFRTDSDGELAGPFTSRRWRLEPEAWQLVVPERP